MGQFSSPYKKAGITPGRQVKKKKNKPLDLPSRKETDRNRKKGRTGWGGQWHL